VNRALPGYWPLPDLSADFCCTLNRLDWDSAHFGMEMGELTLHEGSTAPEQAPAMTLAAAVSRARDIGWAHLSVHVDADNIAFAKALTAAGFFAADRKLCFQYESTGNTFLPRVLFPTRAMQMQDHDAVRDLIVRSAFPSRFFRDPFFPRQRVVDMQLCWFDNILSRASAEHIAVVAEHQGKMAGFAIAERVERSRGGYWHGYSRTLAAAETQSAGAALAAVAAMTAEAGMRGEQIECVVSQSNRAAIRGLEYLQYTMTHREDVFHLDLSAAGKVN
jgi:hypothetical protein